MFEKYHRPIIFNKQNKSGFRGQIYYYSVDYQSITTGKIQNIHTY